MCKEGLSGELGIVCLARAKRAIILCVNLTLTDSTSGSDMMHGGVVLGSNLAGRGLSV